MGVGKAIGDIDFKFLRTGLVTEYSAVGATPWRAKRCFHLRVVKRAFLKIDGATRIGGKTVSRMVGVSGIQAMKHALAHICLAVAIGIGQINQIRRLSHQHATIGKFKTGRIMQSVCKNGHFVGFAVAIGVFQHQQLVVHGLFRLPVRVGRPHSHPQPALGVPRHLHRIGEFWPGFFRGKQVHLQSLANSHLVDRAHTGEKFMLATFKLPRLVGNHRNEIGCIIAAHGFLATLSSSPNHLVAVGSHGVENFHLAIHDHAVGLSFHEPEISTPTIDGVTICRAVAVEPHEIFVEHGLADGFESLGRRFDGRAKQCPVDDIRQGGISIVREMNPINSEALL